MKLRSTLLAAAAVGALASGSAIAAPKAKKHHTAAAGVSTTQLEQEINTLKAEVAELRAQNRSQTADVQAQAQATQAQVAAIQAASAQTQAQVAAVPAIAKAEAAKTTAVAIEKEHHNDKLYFKGITITPGGFLELAGIYRDHFQGNDISSSFAVNFPNSRQYHQHEGRFTARQSRVSFLAQGNVNKDVSLAMYGEFDFQGAAQTANSNGSNSYNPRIRNLYGTIDWNRGDYGLHLLAGQNWSLVTMQSKGITPRAEVTPPQIDAQYIPGFAWARQPGIRLAADFMDHKLWAAIAVENPQTNTVNPVNPVSTNGTPATASGTAVSGTTGGSGFDALNSSSFSDMPDFVAKLAYEDVLGGHGLHIEGFGIVRKFNERLLIPTASNNSQTTLGYGGSINFQLVPKILDVQFSGFGGKGIGRYGSAGLPDVAYSADGRIHPISEYMFLGGATLHANKAWDLYAFAGEEVESRNPFAPNFGSPATSNAGCFVEGGACGQNTRRIRQLTFGFWDKFYQGSFGRAQVGIQYSYTQRQLFDGTGFAGQPQANNSMGFLSFRYYPF